MDSFGNFRRGKKGGDGWGGRKCANIILRVREKNIEGRPDGQKQFKAQFTEVGELLKIVLIREKTNISQLSKW